MPKESEEIEMKKDKLWAKIKVHEELDSWRNVEGGIDRDGIKYVLNIIDQLGEPEVLSQLSIDNNGVHVRNLGETFEVVAVENLLVPKQELPVIPQWVADNIESNKKVGTRLNVAMSEFPELKLEKELGIDENECNELYARAWLDGYTVIEEPLYYAMVKGHELSSNAFKYWNCKSYNSGHLLMGSKFPKASCINRMTKDDWNKLGINDTNADFVKVKETK